MSLTQLTMDDSAAVEKPSDTTGDILSSLMCDCGSQLHQAMAQVEQAGKGAILYMRQEGRGIAARVRT